MIDIAPPPLWLPPKPAIIRPHVEPVRKASFLPGCFPGPVMAAEKEASIVYVDSGMSASNASSYNFGTKNIGTANAKRTLIIAIGWAPQTSATFSHLSIDDNASNSQLAFQSGGTIRIHTLPWPTGTTATITAAASAQMLFCHWSMWAAYDLKSEVPTDSSWIVAGGNPITGNVDVTAGGIAMGHLMLSGASGFTWSGITEDFEITGGIGGTMRMGGASGVFHAAQSPLNVTTNAGANHSQLLASFR